MSTMLTLIFAGAVAVTALGIGLTRLGRSDAETLIARNASAGANLWQDDRTHAFHAQGVHPVRGQRVALLVTNAGGSSVVASVTSQKAEPIDHLDTAPYRAAIGDYVQACILSQRMGRAVHFVGSIPGTDVEEVMRASLRRAGATVHSITDGEINERRNWIIPIIDRLQDDPDLEEIRPANWTSYQDVPRYRVRRGHHFSGDHLELSQFANFEHGYPVFQKIRVEVKLPELAYQVGIPGDLDFAFFTFSPVQALRHRRPFADALGRQMVMIQAVGRHDVIFQLELPVEQVLLTRLPGPARRATAAFLGRGVAGLVNRAPAGSRFGVHLCLGDMNHRALGQLRDVTPLVRLSNAIAAHWPTGRTFEFLHLPLAAADKPPSLEPKFYAPLRKLRVPQDTRFVAGLVHADREVAELRMIRDFVETSVGRQVDLATSCGLGRRSSAQADVTVDLARALTFD